MPGVEPAQFPTNYANLNAVIVEQLALYPKRQAEPPLKP